MALEGSQAGLGREIPQLEGGIIAAAGKGLTVGAIGEGSDPMVVGVPLGMADSGGNIPQANGAVFAATGEGLVVGAKGDRPDSTTMTDERAEGGILIARVNSPEANG